MLVKTPPQSCPRFDLTPVSLISVAKRLIQTSEEVWNHVATIEPETATFQNSIIPLIHDDNVKASESRIIGFLASVAPSQELREASREAEKILADSNIDRGTRRDVFCVVDAVVNKRETLESESQLYLQRLHRDFVINGLALTDQGVFSRLKEIRRNLADLQSSYLHNLDTDSAGIWLSIQELDGVPQDHINKLTQSKQMENKEGQHRVWLNFKRPNLFPVLQHAVNEEVRQRIWRASENRFSERNAPILRDIVLLRDEAAKILGYNNHAELKAGDKMITPQSAELFLNGLREKLEPRGRAELDIMGKLKVEEHRRLGLHADTCNAHTDRMFLWDRMYYDRLLKKENFEFDQDRVAEYFSLDLTLPRLLDILENLFGIEFVKISADGDQITTWHEDVKIFALWDNEDEGGRFLGYLYLDLFPRPNKYTHFGHYSLQPGFIKPDGSRHYPASAFLANYSPPTQTKPSLLKYAEVVSCFHELGHAIHSLVSRTQYARFHGTRTARDFVEVPSILLENFFWDHAVIKSLSCHYLSPENKTEIPDQLIGTLLKVRTVNIGLTNLTKLHHALYDMMLHNPPARETLEKMDLSVVFNSLRKDILMLNGPEALGEGFGWGHGQTHFRAIVGGYDAGYYTYLTSQAYAEDIFQTIFKPLLQINTSKSFPSSSSSHSFSRATMDTKLKAECRRYRYTVLQPGGSTGDEMQLLQNFLKRLPNSEAFVEKIGLDNQSG